MLSNQGQSGLAVPPPVFYLYPTYTLLLSLDECIRSAQQVPLQTPCKVSLVNSMQATAPSAGPETLGGEAPACETGGESKWKPNKDDGWE